MKKAFVSLLGVCLFSVAALAQSTTDLTGVVTDPNGAVVPGVTVKLTDTKTGKEQTDTTNDQGVYKFVKLQPGTGYEITFTAAGFQTTVLKDVALGVATTETHNVTLTIGQVSNTVIVTASGEATLNTTDATIGNVIDQRRMAELPIQIRNSPAALIGLQPGVVGNNVGTTSTNRVGSVTGARADQGNITIDGIDANDVTTGQAFATVGNAPIDAIQEFRAVTTNPNASQGRSSGGQIELVTKSGSNDFHGSVREFNRTAATAANSFFNNRAGRNPDGTLVSPRPQLTRNQFGGSLGGRIIKDHLFFFQDYEGRRDAQGVTYTRVVPLDHFRNGSVAFINNVTGCATNSRLNTTPQCITILTPAQVAAIDPKAIGADAALLSFNASRYPRANDLTLGDGINTGGFRFNAPSHRKDNTYTTRIDWNANDNHKVFGRFNIARRIQTDTVNTVAQQFPDDPESGQIVVRDYAWVVGDTWTLNPNQTNQATVGVTRSGLLFPRPFQPTFPNVFGTTPTATTSGTFGPLSAPFPGFSEQTRFVPVPTIRDDFTWIIGSHTLSIGGSFKPIHQRSSLVNDFNFATVGLGGQTTALDNTLRPGGAAIGTAACTNNANCLRTGTTASGNWDSAFAFLLGRYASVATNFNYSTNGTPFAPGTGKSRDFRYNEYEAYFQDNWKIRNDLTLTYGTRYQYYSVPYEVNGFQACNDVDLNNLFARRLANAANGVSGNNAEPFLRYDLCGKANNARGFSEPDLDNFAPRLSFAYNPSFKEGFMGKVFGDRKTVIRGGGSVVYDRVGGAITFVQDQVSYLFDNSATTLFGNVNPRTALLNDPRFTSITSLPVTNTPPVVTHPFTPFVDSTGTPTGNATQEFNYAIDQHFRTPYSIEWSFGIQRELPGNFILDASYVGRQGRKLFAQADAAQILDFKDPASGQFMLTALNNLQAQLLAGATPATVTVQPWFENQIAAALGAPCTAALGVTCTRFLATNGTTSQEVTRGDTSDLIQLLYANGFLNPNVGLSGQFSTNIYISNQGASSYNGLLVSLRKRFSRGLQFDANYTWSNSIDNGSSVVNTVAGGLVCDLRDLRVCRGPSDFDVRHLFNANFLYELPFGKGRTFGSGASGWMNQLIGGWEVTGIFTARSGLPFSVTSGTAFPVGFNFLSPAALVGNPGALQQSIHDDSATGQVQFFADPKAVFDSTNPTTIAASAVRFPHHGEIGNRNAFRGPGFWNLDAAVLKNFPISEKWGRIQLRWELFNTFNHNAFSFPSTLGITSTSLGVITTSASTPREMQFAIRWDF
jgi:hypothetical protein